ncbi:MAG: hypothetical protein AAGA39_07780 [Pseudomonadota bacterium]
MNRRRFVSSMAAGSLVVYVSSADNAKASPAIALTNLFRFGQIVISFGRSVLSAAVTRKIFVGVVRTSERTLRSARAAYDSKAWAEVRKAYSTMGIVGTVVTFVIGVGDVVVQSLQSYRPELAFKAQRGFDGGKFRFSVASLDGGPVLGEKDIAVPPMTAGQEYDFGLLSFGVELDDGSYVVEVAELDERDRPGRRMSNTIHAVPAELKPELEMLVG